jgi:hypothetical protein
MGLNIKKNWRSILEKVPIKNKNNKWFFYTKIHHGDPLNIRIQTEVYRLHSMAPEWNAFEKQIRVR